MNKRFINLNFGKNTPNVANFGLSTLFTNKVKINVMLCSDTDYC